MTARSSRQNEPPDNGPPTDAWHAVPGFLKVTIALLLAWGIYYMVGHFRPYKGYWQVHHPIPGNLNGSAVERGKYYFQTVGCMECHTVGRYGGTLGPNLTHVASSGLTADFLRHWISNPSKVMPGATMPRLPLTQTQIDNLSAYLLTLK